MTERPFKKHFNTYLLPSNLMPFFYQCLQDKAEIVRESAILCIKNFGAHGELMFIEGVSKDPNPAVRAECALGLGEIGVQTFRSLLLALHDGSQQVKDAASRAILSKMSLQDILAHFADKDHQKQTICCTIKELLVNNNPASDSFLRQDIMHFLSQVLGLFDTQGTNLAEIQNIIANQAKHMFENTAYPLGNKRRPRSSGKAQGFPSYTKARRGSANR